MVPSYLTLRNFLSYGEEVPTLDFNRFHVACLTGNNGHGKSALLDAITYALWGEARKGTSDRKPDEGLLRLGATEMRVEFGFDLGDDSYRVIRSFRKGRRTNTTQLDLQILDPEAETHRPLSEGSSMTQTQCRIDELLSMDYETFINSAFILQGRSNEFTQRSSRQRKQVLADILHLDRYERLRDLARERLQTTMQSAERLQRRRDELRQRLGKVAGDRAELETTAALLTATTEQVRQLESELNTVTGQIAERKRLLTRREELSATRERASKRKVELELERSRISEQLERDAALIETGPEIEAARAEFDELTRRVTSLDATLAARQRLELERVELEAAIASARHQIERDREKWEVVLCGIEEQTNRTEAVIARESDINENRARLEEMRARVRDGEARRERWLELQRKRERCELRIRAEAERLGAEADSLRGKLVTMRLRRDEMASADARVETLKLELASMKQQSQELDAVTEQGAHLNADIAASEQRETRLAADHAALRERIQLFEKADGPECPLCGSQLDGEHQEKVDEELTAQQGALESERETARTRVGNLHTEREELRERYRTLSESVRSLDDVHQDLARQEALAGQRRESECEIADLEDKLLQSETTVAKEQFATPMRHELDDLVRDLDDLDFDEGGQATLRKQLEASNAETEMALLDEARERREQLGVEAAGARRELALAVDQLDGHAYASAQFEQIARLEQRLAEMSYDGEEHECVRACLHELRDATARREQLLLARQRRESGSDMVTRCDHEIGQLKTTLERTTADLAATNKDLETLAEIESKRERLVAVLEDARRERDGLLQRQGSLQAELDRYMEWEVETDALAAELAELQDQHFILEELTTAFGKDGIQALIIESAIPEIESEANAILARLTDNRIQISIESLRDLKKGGTRETLDVIISDEMGERPYHLYSGGEAFRTDFALRIALAKTLARRAGTRLRTLIVDEGFGTQDSDGIDYLIQAINDISVDFDKLIVVTHLPELKNAFPVQIHVTKHPEVGSRFEIIENS